MKKFLKKGLAVLLSMAIVLSMMPAAVFADDSADASPDVSDKQATAIAPGDEQSDTQGSSETDTSSDEIKSEEPQNNAAANGTTYEAGWLNNFIALDIIDVGGKINDDKCSVTLDVFNPKNITITPYKKGYEGTVTYKSSNTELATVDENGNVTINDNQKTGTVEITVNAAEYANSYGTWPADTTAYEIKLISTTIDFTKDGAKAAQLLQAGGGSATWDAENKALTLKNINYTVPAAIEDLSDGENGERPAIKLPDGARIRLIGGNTINILEENNNRNCAIYFDGSGNIARDSNSEASTLNINGTVYTAIAAKTELAFQSQLGLNVDINVKTYSGLANCGFGGAITTINGTLAFGAVDSIKINYEAPINGGAIRSGDTITINRCENLDIDVKNVSGGCAIYAKGGITLLNCYNSDIKADVSGDYEAYGVYSETGKIKFGYSEVKISSEGTNKFVGLKGDSIALDQNKLVFVRATKAAFSASSFSHTYTTPKNFVISENYDGSDATGKLDENNFKNFKYFKVMNPQVLWLSYVDNSVQNIKYCAGTAPVREPVYGKEYKGNITYTSSDESIATVDSNGNIIVNDEGKLGTVTITANATADPDLNYKAMSASYKVKIDGIADFELNGKRAAQLLAANGGEAVWLREDKTLRIEDINYTAAPITEGDKPVGVYLPDGTTVRLAGKNTIKLDEHEDNGSAVVFFNGKGTIRGTGSEGALTIEGQALAGIYAAKTARTPNLLIQKAVLNCNIKNTLTEENAGGAIYVPDGSIETKNSKITVKYSGHGEAAIYAGGNITISGGAVDATGYGSNGMGGADSSKLIITDGNIKSRSDEKFAIFFPGGLEIDETAVPNRKVSANFDGSNAVDYGSDDQPSEVRYFEALGPKEVVSLEFEQSQRYLAYCAETATYAVNKPDDYTGEITYTSSDDSIATVDNNGKVTVNSNGKVGSVTITATAEETTKYAKSSASYTLSITDKADFSVNPERALQLIKSDGGEATWNSNTRTLAINGVNYDGTYYFGKVNVNIALTGENNIYSVDEDSTITFSGEGNLNWSGNKLTINNSITLGEDFTGTVSIDVRGILIYQMIVKSGRMELSAEASLSTNSDAPLYVAKLDVSGGTFVGTKKAGTIVGLLNTSGSAKALGSKSPNRSKLETYALLNASQYYYVIVSDEQANYLSFAESEKTARYIDGSVQQTATAPSKAGEVKYSSSDESIATVDSDGLVTFNNNGKTGKVTITAACEAVTGFLAESTSYDLTITGAAAFDKDSETAITRSIQLLQANGGTASWDSASETLTLEDIKFEYTAQSTDADDINNAALYLPLWCDVNLILKGSNEIKIAGYVPNGISGNKLTLSGNGSLLISGEVNYAIGADGTMVKYLTLDEGADVTVDVKVNKDSKETLAFSAFEMKADSNLTIKADFSDYEDTNTPARAIRCDTITLNDKTSGGLNVDMYNVNSGRGAVPIICLNSYSLDSGTTVLKREGTNSLSGGYGMIANFGNSNLFAKPDNSGVMVSTNYDGTDATAYDKTTYDANYSKYKYMSISKKESTLELVQIKDRGYCDEPMFAVAVKNKTSKGTIRYYIDEGADIASIDKDTGTITINSEGKCGKVTVRALQSEYDGYAAATATATFNVLNVADFTVDGDRAVQLIDGGKGNVSWNSESNALTILGDCETTAKIVFPDKTVNIYVENGVNVCFNGGMYSRNSVDISGDSSLTSSLTVKGTVEIGGTISVLGGKVDISGTIDKLGKLTINAGEVTITGDSVPTALANLTMDESNVWTLASVNEDGSEAEEYKPANKDSYKYFYASDRKSRYALCFDQSSIRADYCANNPAEVILKTQTDYTGKVTYKSSDESIATVDADTGKVTLNSTGKIGEVTITASGTQTNKYAADEVHYKLNVTADTADFARNGERAAQLLAANGGSATWDESANTLTIEDINYEKTGEVTAELDMGCRILLPPGVTVTVNGTNTIKGTDVPYVIKFSGNGTINGTGMLNVSGLTDGDGLYPDTPVYISGKLTIDGATVNTSDARYGFSGDRGATLDVQSGCAYAKGSNKALSANVDFTYADAVRVNASTEADGTLGDYDSSKINTYKQIRAKYVKTNKVAFTKTIDDFDYCAKSTETITAAGLGTGEITYEVTEGADIADVDNNGKVTINSTGKFGDVTITATQAADDDYATASAECSFKVRGVADFTHNNDEPYKTRSLQLLKANGGEASYNYGWNNGTCTLTLENITFDSKSTGYAIKLKSYSQIIVKGENTIHGGIYIDNSAKNITGSGTLNIMDADTGIYSKHGIPFTDGVTVNLTNVKYGFGAAWSNEDFEFTDCSVTVSANAQVFTKTYTRAKFDENKIRAVASTSSDGANAAKYKAANKDSYKYFKATVKKTITASEAYELKTTDKSLEIGGTVIDRSNDIVKKSADYDGDIANAMIKYKKTDSEDLIDKITAPGEYEVIVSMATTENYQPIEAAGIGTVTVAKGDVKADAAFTYEDQTAEYDGQEHTPVITTAEGYDGTPVLSYKDMTDENAQITSEAPKNAGTYEVYVSAAATDNFAEITGTKVGTFTITPKQFTAEEVAKVSLSRALTYNGKKQEAEYALTDAAKAIGYDGSIELVYMQNGEEVENINAGNYDVYAKAAATRNFTAVTAGRIGSFTIGKKAVTKDDIFDYETAQTAKYDGESPKFAIKVKDTVKDYDGTAVITYRQGDKVVANPTAVGEYDVYIALSDNTNFTQANGDADVKAATMTIAKESVKASEQFEYTNEEFEWDGKAKAATVTKKAGAVYDGRYTVSYKQSENDITDPTDVGTYDVYVTIEETDNCSVEEATAKVGTLTITKAAVTEFSITGTFVAWDNTDNAEIKLYATEDEKALTDAEIRDDMRNNNGEKAITGYSVDLGQYQNGAKSGQYTQNFTISGVTAGTYKLAIFKTKRNGSDPYVVTVVDVTVTDKDYAVEEQLNMWLYGDVNFDGKINALDVGEVLRKSARRDSVVDENNAHQFLAADSDNNKKINALDVGQLLRKSARRSCVFDDYK